MGGARHRWFSWARPEVLVAAAALLFAGCRNERNPQRDFDAVLGGSPRAGGDTAPASGPSGEGSGGYASPPRAPAATELEGVRRDLDELSRRVDELRSERDHGAAHGKRHEHEPAASGRAPPRAEDRRKRSSHTGPRRAKDVEEERASSSEGASPRPEVPRLCRDVLRAGAATPGRRASRPAPARRREVSGDALGELRRKLRALDRSIAALAAEIAPAGDARTEVSDEPSSGQARPRRLRDEGEVLGR